MKIIFALYFCFFSFCVVAQDGKLDSTFGNTGVVTSAYFGNIGFNHVAVQPDGKIIQVATVTTGGGSGAYIKLYRHQINGTIDSSFGTNGTKTISLYAHTIAGDMVLQPDGKILLCGHTDTVIAYQPFVMRLNSDGSNDTGFGYNGHKIIPVSLNQVNYAHTLALQPDGKILIGGMYNLQAGIIRLTTTGILDTSFDTDGIVTSHFGDAVGTNEIYDILVQADGKLVAVGGCYKNSVQQILTAKYLTNGSVDQSFGNSGSFISNSGSDIFASSVTMQPDGKLVMTLNMPLYPPMIYHDFMLMRLLANGTPDQGFGTNGMVVTDFPSVTDAAGVVLVQPDGKILACGVADINMGVVALIRYTSSGAPDNSFGNNGRMSYTANGMVSSGANMASQGNKLIIAGISFNGSLDQQTPTLFRIHYSSRFYDPLCNVAAPGISLSGNRLASTSTSNNQWYLNGTPVPGATGQIYTATTPGAYSVAVITNGCSSALSQEVMYYVTAIEPVEAKWKLHVGPNPVTNQLFINHGSVEHLTIEILNLAGQRVYFKTGLASSLMVDFSKLTGGLYVVKIVGNKTKSEFRKIVVKK